MRLWTLHPRYLDPRGLVALWREALLAQAVLKGETKGYIHHPQLIRFQRHPSPVGAIAEYLRIVHEESAGRGYSFDRQKVSRASSPYSIAVTRGQLEYEWNHLMRKLALRAPHWRSRLDCIRRPLPHPVFQIVPGGVEPWESVGRAV